MGQKRFLSSILIACFALSGCGYAMEEIGLFKTGGVILKGAGVGSFSESTISFSVVQNTSLKTCLNCHDKKTPILDSEEKVFAARAEILDSVRTEYMPPSRAGFNPLTACEKKILETWFDNKTNHRVPQRVKDLAECSSSTTTPAPVETPTPTPAPIETPTPAPSPSPSPEPTQPDIGQLELSYKVMRTAFLETKCLNCHSATAKRPKHPLLDSVENIKTDDQGSSGLAIGASGAESNLYLVTVPDPNRDIMPPTRANLPAVTPAESDYIKRWIDAGMPE